MVKDEGEIALLREACAISDRAFDAVLPLPGNTLTLVGLIGAALTLAAVVIAVIPPRRGRGSQLSA